MSVQRNAGTRAIVTGGAQGIGFAVAQQLVAEGCKALVLVGRSPEKGALAVAALEKLGAEAIFVSADMSRPDECASVVEAGLERFGTINGLVNAAASSARGTLVDTTPELFDSLFATNVRGPFFMMQGVVRHLLAERKPGAIVNVLSMSAHAGQSFLTPYSASRVRLQCSPRMSPMPIGETGSAATPCCPDGWTRRARPWCKRSSTARARTGWRRRKPHSPWGSSSNPTSSPY
jgi:NAD(P)-dependent dehydrogenase (short-subunit alcohol dehydrogenase family)